MQPKDKAYIWDIIQAAKDITEFVEGKQFSDFENDKKTRLAIERLLLIIGEAANHISVETKTEYERIPWSRIIGLRNILAHEYGDILADRVWGICSSGIPELLDELKNINLQ